MGGGKKSCWSGHGSEAVGPPSSGRHDPSPFALLPFCSFVLLLFCPFALLSFVFHLPLLKTSLAGPEPSVSEAAEADADREASLRDLLCLTMVPGVGPHTGQALLEAFGSASKVLDASVSRLKQVQGVGAKLAERIAQARREQDAAGELGLCRRAGVEVVGRDDPTYPPPLGDIPDPPNLLYRLGTYEPRDQLAVALVGSRKCTPYGMRVAERLGANPATRISRPFVRWGCGLAAEGFSNRQP